MLAQMQFLQRAYPDATLVSAARSRCRERRAEAARGVRRASTDPEIPVLTIADLGMLREVDVDERGRGRRSRSCRPIPAVRR